MERNKTEKNRGMFFGVLNRISPLNCEILVITYFQLPKSEVMICRNVYSRKPKKRREKKKVMESDEKYLFQPNISKITENLKKRKK